MAEEGGGKMKGRRPGELGKPYDRRQSIIGRVKDSVKDMLAPSWLVDLVSSVKKKPPTQAPEQRNELNIDQRQQMTNQQTPSASIPAPHILHHTPSPLDSSISRDMRTPQFHQGMTSTPAQPPAFSSQHLPFSFMDRGNTSSLIVNGAEDQSEMSEFSMSAANLSMTPHPDRKQYQQEMLNMSESHIAQLRQDLRGSMTPSRELEAKSSENTSQTTERSFLWSSDIKHLDSSGHRHNRPGFNLSAFQVPGKSKDRSSVFGSDYQLSPYYPGKTTFGGAAAQNKVKFKPSTPYQTTPSRRQVKAQPLNNSNLGGITSSTAKRILDTLDRMSTPVNDAKKIPSLNSSLIDSPLSFSPSSYPRSDRRRSVPGRFHHALEGGPPVRGLNTPSMAAIAKNVHKPPVSGLMTQSVTSGSPSLSSQQGSGGQQTAPSQLRTGGPDSSNPGSSRSGKMKRERSQHYSSKHVDEEEEVEIPNLPTDFVLPVASMPAFNFGLTTTATTKTNGQRTVSPMNDFRFSSPIAPERPGSADSSAANTTPPSPQKFQFSSPIPVDPVTIANHSPTTTHVYSRDPIRTIPSYAPPQYKSEQMQMTKQNEVKKPQLSTTSPAALKVDAQDPSLRKKPTVPIQEEPSFGLKPSSELKQGSVMDILGKMSPATSQLSKKEAPKGASVVKPFGQTASGQSPGTLQPASQLSSGSVMDILGSKSQSEDKPSLASMFKKPKGSWDCPLCMINNPESANKCPACETAKPGPPPPAAVSQPVTVAVPAGQSLSSLFKKPEGTWECPTCMIQNGPSVAECPACQTKKPGPPPPQTSTPPQFTPTPSSEPSLSEMFKAAPGSWDCPTCMIQNKADVSKCPACETQKPGAVTKPSLLAQKQDTIPVSKMTGPGFGDMFKKPSGTWECDTCMVFNKPEATKCIACETPKPGLKPTTSFTSPGGFKFGGTSVAATKTSTTLDSASKSAFGGPFGNTPSSSTVHKTEDLCKGPAASGAGFKLSVSSDSKTPFAGVFAQANKTNSNKSYSSGTAAVAASGGFKLPGVSAVSSDPAPKTDGGFKFPSTITKPDLNTTNQNASLDKTDTKPATFGGFKFSGTPASVNTVSATNAVVSTAAALTPSTTKPAFGESSGIFGSASASSRAASSVLPVVSTTTAPAPVLGGFSFGSTTSASSFSTTTSTPSASAPPVASSVGTTKEQQAPAAGLFAFGKKPELNVESTATTCSASVGPFAGPFSATSNSTSTFGGASTATFSTPPGGFNFKPSSETTKPTPPSDQFTFTAKPLTVPAADAKPLGVGATLGTKRTMTGEETDMSPKKRGSITGGTSGFSFSATTQPSFGAATQTAGVSSFPSFGAATTTTTAPATFGAASAAAAPVFGATTPAAPMFGTTTPGTQSTNAFAPTFGAVPGAPTTTTTAAAPSFAFGAPAAATTTTFGTTGVFGSAAPATTSASAPGGFNFAAAAAATDKAVFQFGASTSQTAAAPSQQQAPSFTPNPTPSFNFTGGQTAPPAAANSTPFAFSASQPSAPSNPFSFTGGTPTTGTLRRPVKKAVRKLRK